MELKFDRVLTKEEENKLSIEDKRRYRWEKSILVKREKDFIKKVAGAKKRCNKKLRDKRKVKRKEKERLKRFLTLATRTKEDILRENTILTIAKAIRTSGVIKSKVGRLIAEIANNKDGDVKCATQLKALETICKIFYAEDKVKLARLDKQTGTKDEGSEILGDVSGRVDERMRAEQKKTLELNPGKNTG